MSRQQAEYTKLLGKESTESFHDSDTSSLTIEAGYEHERFHSFERKTFFKRAALTLIILLLVAYVIGSLTFMVMLYRGGEYQLRAPDPPYTPAADVIRYVTVNSADGYDEDMQGFPSEAHDKAWMNLVHPSLSRASYEEMQLGHEDPEHSVAVADGGGGYMISLGVYHELHCMRRLKMYVHKEHYYPKLAHGSPEDTYELKHLNHCLEAIRLSLMCAGNTAIYSFEWPHHNMKVRKPITKTNSQRTCVNWNLLEKWARNRTIGMNPKLERPAVDVGSG